MHSRITSWHTIITIYPQEVFKEMQYLCFQHCRRVYQGLLKLLNGDVKSEGKESASRNAKKSRKKRTREVSKLVKHVALGNENLIKAKGTLRMITKNE